MKMRDFAKAMGTLIPKKDKVGRKLLQGILKQLATRRKDGGDVWLELKPEYL